MKSKTDNDSQKEKKKEIERLYAELWTPEIDAPANIFRLRSNRAIA